MLCCPNKQSSLPKKAETKYAGDLTPAMTWPLVMGRQMKHALVLGEHRDLRELELNHHCNILTFCTLPLHAQHKDQSVKAPSALKQDVV